nr:Chain X, EH1 PEPTIDE [Homo sapiens]2CE8_Y Chain Y, EH1 PEPTIDE [Homo sapiens]
MFSIDNILA